MMGVVAADLVVFDESLGAAAAEQNDNFDNPVDVARTADVFVVGHAAPSIGTDCMTVLDCIPSVDGDILAGYTDQGRIREMEIASLLAALKKKFLYYSF